MADLHIQEFFGDAARIVVSLYRMFPRPVSLFVEDIAGPDEPDEYGVHSHRHQSCFATMLFLKTEGFINYTETIRSEALDQAALTGTALSLLLKPLEGVKMTVDADLPESVMLERSTAIYQLEQAVMDNNPTETSAIMQQLLDTMTSR